eukprot:s2288_g5.t2
MDAHQKRMEALLQKFGSIASLPTGWSFGKLVGAERLFVQAEPLPPERPEYYAGFVAMYQMVLYTEIACEARSTGSRRSLPTPTGKNVSSVSQGSTSYLLMK